MFKLLRLALLRSIERFFAQLIFLSTQPIAFMRERICLGDTTNFLRAARFFLSAISSAFLAEVATLHLLGIGNLTEPYYWLFVLLTALPFVLFCFLLVRFVAPLSFKDVLHLCFYPVGAGAFTGAAAALVASLVVAWLVAVGYIPDIKYDFTQWGDEAQLVAVDKQVLYDCLKENSLLFTILAAGFQGAYTTLKPPIDSLSYVRPVITVLYFIIAACLFMTAIGRRKALVFGLVLLAALFATIATYSSVAAYLAWSLQHSNCQETLVDRGIDRTAETALKAVARDLEAAASKQENERWNISVRAEGRTIINSYRLKRPIPDMDQFHRFVGLEQKRMLDMYCSDDSWFFRSAKATFTQTFYSSEGERLISFSIDPSDCSQR